MTPIRRRRVFYISGYDPRGPMHYHKLYREECAKQNAVNGLGVAVGSRKTGDAVENHWTLSTADTETTYTFLRWDDLVRARWPRGVFGIYWDIVRYAWGFAWRGVFTMILRNSWPTFVTAAYPPALVAGLFLMAVLVGAVIGLVLGGWAWLALAVVLGAPFLLRKPLEERLNAFWLGRGCAFLVDRGGGRTAEVEARCLAFAGLIAGAVKAGEADEVLVCCHSVGTHLAITTLAAALDLMPAGARVSLLTVGQTIAMAAVQPGAGAFRAALLKVALSAKVQWIDVSSAIDSSSMSPDNCCKSCGTSVIGVSLRSCAQSARVNSRYGENCKPPAGTGEPPWPNQVGSTVSMLRPHPNIYEPVRDAFSATPDVPMRSSSTCSTAGHATPRASRRTSR